MGKAVRVLMAEDNEDDAILAIRVLIENGFDPYCQRVETFDELRLKLQTESWDCVISDYSMFQMDGLEVLSEFLQYGLDIPFILVSGTIGEQLAVKAMKAGASNYIMKKHLSLLGPCLERELRDAELRRESRRKDMAIHNNEIFFRSIIEKSHDVISLVDTSGKIKYVSPSISNVLGYTVREYLSGDFLSFIHPEDIGALSMTYLAIMRENGGSRDLILRFKHKDTTWRWLEGSGTNLTNEPAVNAIVVNFRDITERIKANDDLTQLSRNLQGIMDATLETIIMVDREFVIRATNSTFLSRLALPLERVVGFPYFNFVPEALIPKRKECLEYVFATGNSTLSEDIRNNMMLEHNYFPVLEDGVVKHVVMYIRNVTEKKKAEYKIQQYTARLEAAEENAGLGSWEFSVDNQQSWWSKQMFRMNGFEVSETIPAFGIYLEHIHPDDYGLLLDSFLRISNGDEPVMHVFRSNPQLGKLRYFMPTVHAQRDAQGNVVKFIGTQLDVTEQVLVANALKESEDLFSKAFLCSPAPMAIIRLADHIYLEANESFLQLTEHERGSVIGKNTESIQFTLPEETQRIRELVKNNITFRNVEFEGWSKSGKRLNLLVSSEYIELAGAACTINTFKDITERKRAELELEQYREHLEELVVERTRELEIANTTKDKFFSIIAHDLRNPFTSILSSSDLLLLYIDRNDQARIRKFASSIHSSVVLINKLLENLLEWSRLQTGTLVPVVKRQNMKAIVDEVCNLCSVVAINKDIRLVNTVILDVDVACDVDMVKTVLRNLISNAIKFTNIGGIVEVCPFLFEGFLEITVSDNGVGIPPENLQYMFAIEKNISTLGTRDEKGTGLGLILCKELIEKQNGEIWVESILGKGSDFKFTIPLWQDKMNPK